MSEDSDIFEKAALYVKTNGAHLDTETLLKLYAFYKQATVGDCNVAKPSVFSFEAKTKWKAWNELRGASKAEARRHYVERVDQSFENWRRTDAGENFNAWVSVSCPRNDEKQLADNEKTIFDWVKEGNVERVKSLTKSYNVNAPDEEGLTLLHWATDRGDLETVQYLVAKEKADLNVRDKEGQTPLHYAVACGYPVVVKYLLSVGADSKITDASNLIPLDLAETEEMFSLLK